MRIKLLVLAAIALVLNLMTISPVKAEVGMVTTNINTPSLIKRGCSQTLCQSFRVVEEMAPMFMNIGSNIKSHIFFRQDLGDRLFNLNQKSGIACLVDGQGSEDGSILCGKLDKY